MKRRISRITFRLILGVLALIPLWIGASVHEMITGERLLPWPAYGNCEITRKPSETIRIGLYEEFPNPWRLSRLREINFPVVLAIPAASSVEFLELRDTILREYPHVQEVYYWPLLSYEEGYYPGSWSNADAVKRVSLEAGSLQAQGIPTLWDLEVPLRVSLWNLSPKNWLQNQPYIDAWFSKQERPVHIWRSHTGMGLSPLFLRLIGMHFDPTNYKNVWLHLDLYNKGNGRSTYEMKQILRCGVEAYGDRFIPSFGVMNDGEGRDSEFISDETLRRDLLLAREVGITEVWLFGVNGLTTSRIAMIRETQVQILPDDAAGTEN